jgi:hypothetical protein
MKIEKEIDKKIQGGFDRIKCGTYLLLQPQIILFLSTR